MDQAVRKHPGYKEAIDQIVKRFQKEGYGIIITDEEIDEYMSIEKPSGAMTYEQYKAIEMERLQRYRAIESLLNEYNICLVRSKEQPGFEVLSPKDQVTRAFDKRMTKVRRELNRAQAALMNVNHALLSMDEEGERQKKIMRAAFIKSAMNKRKLSVINLDEKKLIEQK